jgi:hypothetical protein
MSIRHSPLAVLLVGFCMTAYAADPPPLTGAPPANANAPSQAEKPQQSTPPAHTTPPSAASQPTSVSPNTYHGAQGKKADPGTACNSARLKKNGALDCGMTGKAATPARPK